MRNVTQCVNVIALLLTFVGLLLVRAQLEQTNEHQRWSNYNQLNLHYSALYRDMPDDLDKSKCKSFGDLPLKAQRWIRSYFNLYSEEHYLFKQKLIPEEMWTKRIDGGVNVNLIHYPVLAEGYVYWKELGSFTHPPEFIPFVDKKIAGLGVRIDRASLGCGTYRATPNGG